jgi:acetyl-CoA synthetase
VKNNSHTIPVLYGSNVSPKDELKGPALKGKSAVTTKSIESILLEERSFPPPDKFAKQANIRAKDLEALRQKAAQDPIAFWAELAREELQWHEPFTVTLDDADAPNYRWFTDGRLNVSVNCLDVHLEERGHETAIIFEGEPGDTRRLSYRELHAEVCRFANALRSLGVQAGDRVVIYMPLVPEAVIAMYGCARIGAVHSVVFGGFSALSLKDRIEDARAKVLVTADGGWRGGNIVPLKVSADKALAGGCPTIEKVVVVRRTGEPLEMNSDRDVWWHDVLEGQSPVCEPEWVNAEHPLFLLYTSGSTGKPKGIQHSTGGYLLGVKLTTKWVLDVKASDVFWCTADVGWVTGHSYVAYGPLSVGAAILLYEGGPTFPDGGRFWKNCETHGVTVFYTAPTAIRALMKLGDELPAKYDLSKLRLLGTVGEPINPEAWMWYHRVIGRERCPVVDTWWQTETGAIMIAPVPGSVATKPGSCTLPLPGVDADIVDDQGNSVTSPNAGGYLVIRKPWPAMLRTIWGDNDRYLQTYWEKFQNRFYVAGDSAHRDKDGYFWIMGRIDDVLNVAGHRLGTMEIESALVSHMRVAEAAVVGRPHEIKGESVFAYVVCKGVRPSGDTSQLVQELRAWVGEQLGAIAKPDEIRFTDNLPKTRSGKIMRRLLRAVAAGQEISQDVSTLENPAIIDQLRGVDTAASPASSHSPPAKRKAPSKKGNGKAGAPKVSAAKAPPKKSGAKPAVKKSAARKGASTAARTKSSTARKAAAKPNPRKVSTRAKPVAAARKTKVAGKTKGSKVQASAKRKSKAPARHR